VPRIGSESSDLPGFVVLLSGQNQPDGGKSCWGSGFLPTIYQGVQFRSNGEYVADSRGHFVLMARGAEDRVSRQLRLADEFLFQINSFALALGVPLERSKPSWRMKMTATNDIELNSDLGSLASVRID